MPLTCPAVRPLGWFCGTGGVGVGDTGAGASLCPDALPGATGFGGVVAAIRPSVPPAPESESLAMPLVVAFIQPGQAGLPPPLLAGMRCVPGPLQSVVIPRVVVNVAHALV